MYLKLLFFLFIAGICTSCNTSKQLDKAVARKPDPQVIYPSKPKETPASTRFIDDYESLYTERQQTVLDSLARSFEKSNLISIKITTLKDSSTTANPEQITRDLLNEWGALHGKSDHCMMILISKARQSINIEYGEFVKRLLSDAEAASIIENSFKPFFEQEQYYNGTQNGVNALMDAIRKNIRY